MVHKKPERWAKPAEQGKGGNGGKTGNSDKITDSKPDPATRRPDFDRKFTGNFDNTVGAKSQQFPFAMRRDAFEVVPLEKLENEASEAAAGSEVEMEDVMEMEDESEKKQKAEEEKASIPKKVKEPKPEKKHRGQAKREADAAEAAALKAAIMENADSDDQDEIDLKLN